MRRVVVLLLILLTLAACGTDTGPTEAPADEEPVATEAVVETEEADDADADPTPTREDAEPAESDAVSGDETRLILATTTSTDDSGLLDVILPDFEAEYSVSVDVVAVGTGQALELGRNGDADVVLVHARAREDDFVDNGYGTERADVMFNDFVIIGPAEDPAGISGMEDASDALAQIAESEASFISRGDDSGTHTKELGIWEEAGITPEGDWYVSAGQGMGSVLTMSNEQQAYTLTDRGTYIARQAEGLDLEIMVEGDSQLANPYGVIPVVPENRPLGESELPEQFVEWLTSVETQEMIADYQVEGQQLFFPDSEAYRTANSAE